MTAVTFKVRFGCHPSRVQAEPVVASEARQPEGHASRTARYLAMAWAIERGIQSGRLRSYEDAARWLGISLARASMLSHLIFLAPAIQEAILRGDTRVSENRLREVCRVAEWGEQRGVVRP